MNPKDFVSRTGIPIDEDDLELRDALYNPDQPRDDHGRWSPDGSDGFESDADHDHDAVGVSYGNLTNVNKQSALASTEHDLQALADAAVDPGNSRYVNTERIRDILKADTGMSAEDRKKNEFRYARDKSGKVVGAAQARRSGNNLEVVSIGALTRAIGRTIIRVMQEEAVKSGLKVVLTTAYNIFRGAADGLRDLAAEDERTMLTSKDRAYVRMSLRVMEEFQRREAAFNPDQSRDERGRFAPTPGEGADSVKVSTQSFFRPTLDEGKEWTDADWEVMEKAEKEDAIITTGNTDGNFASELSVYYTSDATLVSPSGEFNNSYPWKYAGKLSPKDVLEDYFALIGENIDPEDVRSTVKAFKQTPVKFKTAEFNPDQARDEHGRWTDSGGFEHTGITWKQPIDPDTGRPIPIPVSSVEAAIPLILDGKVVELPEPRDVVTLIDRFRQIALDAKAKGEKAPDYDLCNVSVAGSNLFCGDKLRSAEYPEGVPRLAMPQLGGKPEPGSEADKLPRNPWDPSEVDGAAHFVAHLQGIGMKTSTEVMPASKLKASQRELVGPKVAGMILDRTFEPAKNPIFISNDNYVVDGHHRWAAVLGRDAEDNKLGDLMMNVVRVNAPISEVLQIANAWSKKFGIKQNAGVQGKK